MAGTCVDTVAAQGLKGGLSLGGITPECQSIRTAKFYFDLADTFQESDPEKAAEYMAAGHLYAEKAAPGGFATWLSKVKGVAIDGAIVVGSVVLLGVPF